jgi:hypothetical protein
MRATCTQSINQQRKEINVYLKFNQAFKEIACVLVHMTVAEQQKNYFTKNRNWRHKNL